RQIDQYGHGEEISFLAMPGATGHHTSPAGDGIFHHFFHGVQTAAIGQRPEINVRVKTVPDSHLRYVTCKGFDKPVMNAVAHEKTSRGHTHLASVSRFGIRR